MKKSELYGAVGSAIFNGLLLLLLFLIGFSIDKKEIQEEGIEINFGDGLDGAPAPEEMTTPTAFSESEPIPLVPEQTAEVPSITQEDPSVAIAAEKKRQEKLKQQEQIRLQKELERQEQAQIAAEQKAAAERAAKTAKANALAAGAFGSGGNSASGNGVGGGGASSTPGNPIGRGSSGGNEWSLVGRGLVGKFYKPSYVGTQEGRIIVGITVDASGTVIGATIKQGTTISDEALRKECISAARKIKFTTSKSVGNAIGEIIYRFSQQ